MIKFINCNNTITELIINELMINNQSIIEVEDEGRGRVSTPLTPNHSRTLNDLRVWINHLGLKLGLEIENRINVSLG